MTIDIRQPQVNQDKIWDFFNGRFQTGFPFTLVEDLMTARFQNPPDEKRILLVIFNNKYLTDGGLRCNLP